MPVAVTLPVRSSSLDTFVVSVQGAVQGEACLTLRLKGPFYFLRLTKDAYGATW